MIILHQANRKSLTDRRPRHSFTLIELLIVMVIMGILMSLAFPAFNSVMRTARVTEVNSEIAQLSSALAEFKTKFDFFPPSFIRLHVRRDDWNNDPRSRAVIRRMFPQFDFIGNENANPPIYPDGGAPWTTTRILTGAECLVFFLGGVPKDGVPNGFSNNPLRPFSNAGTSRIVPFFDFDSGRLGPGTTNGLLVFKSPLASQTNPYRYYSAYDGTGYRCSEVRQYQSSFDVYRQKKSEDIDRDCILDNGEDINGNGRLDFGAAWKPKSYQIICPGFDDQYGLGGKYDPASADVDFSQAREAERDNITSFHTGMLAP